MQIARVFCTLVFPLDYWLASSHNKNWNSDEHLIEFLYTTEIHITDVVNKGDNSELLCAQIIGTTHHFFHC